MTDRVVDTTVAPQFHDLASRLEELVVLIEDLSTRNRPGPPWTASSLAGREAARTDLADAWGTRPLRETWLRPTALLGFVTDHLRAMAATIRTEQVMFATLSLLRPTLEAAAVAYDLIDPALDSRERLRRGVNIELESYVEQKNMMIGHPQQQAQIGLEIEKIRGAALRHGYTFTRAKKPPVPGLARPVWLPPRPPSDQGLIAGLMTDPGEADVTARLLHRLVSAVVHAQPHGMSPFWERQAYVGGADGVGTVPLVLTFGWLAVLTAGVVIGLDKLMRRGCDVYGWDAADWEGRLAPLWVEWRGWLHEAQRSGPRG